MRPAFVQGVKKRKDIQVVRIVKDVMTKKGFLPENFVSGDQILNYKQRYLLSCH